ncbi:ribonuclease H-like protein [Nemania sp. FL0031]|nr:ribonuclease H-like protein [Nemania sp. FL0031]
MSSSFTPYQVPALNSGIKAVENLAENKTPEGSYSIVDTVAGISALVDILSGLPSTPPSIYIDLEGPNLSRLGSVSIMQIHISTTGQNYLVDITNLKGAAFSTQGTQTPNTLKGILESPLIPKVFFDVRMDSDALHYHYNIKLQGVQDLQLMELATRPGNKRFIAGLKKCIDRDMNMTSAEKDKWTAAKDEGRKLFAPEKGGSYEVFDRRPLAEKIALYCVQDVQYLPRLWDLYNRKLTANWAVKVQGETAQRVVKSQALNFNGDGPHMRLGPEGW